MKIGIDIGYGDIKTWRSEPGAIGTGGEKFPTAVVPVSGDRDLLGRTDPDMYHFEGRTYRVGTTSKLDDEQMNTLSWEWLREYSPLLLAKSLDGVTDATACVGIPLGLWSKRRELKARLLADGAVRVSDGAEIARTGLDIKILPQGVGVLFDYMFTEGGNENDIEDDLLILDIGYNTLDILGASGGRPLSEKAEMKEREGVSRIVHTLKKQLANEGYRANDMEVRQALRDGYLLDCGAKIDISEMVAGVVGRYSERLIGNVLGGEYRDIVRKVDKLIVAGGGAYLIDKYLPAKYRGYLFIPESPEYSNARGFFKSLLVG